MVDKDGNNIKEKKLVQQTGYKIGYVFDVSQTEQIKGKKEYPLEFVDDLKLKVESYDETLELVKRCKFLVIISLIGYCILAILNFTILPYSVPIYDWDGLVLHRFMVLLILVIILLVLVDIRNVIKKLVMID